MRSLGTLARERLNGLVALTLSLCMALGMLATPALAEEKDKPEDKNVDRRLQRIGHVIVIYQENWSFDSLYGLFPGADGLANGFGQLPQKDKSTGYSSLIYTTPSPLNNGVDPNFPSVGGQLALSATQLIPLPLIPYDFSDYIAPNAKTGDIIHRFYHEQLQIDNGV